MSLQYRKERDSAGLSLALCMHILYCIFTLYFKVQVDYYLLNITVSIQYYRKVHIVELAVLSMICLND